jgi:hypothetical protein
MPAGRPGEGFIRPEEYGSDAQQARCQFSLNGIHVLSNDLLNLPFEYEHKEQFNFDDYIFTKEDARGEKKKKSSLMGTIKSGKEALQKEINDGKKTFEEGKEKVEKAKTDYTEVKGDVEDIVSTIKGENNDE